MSPRAFASLFTVLLIGLFIGTNLGVLIMCLMRMTSDRPQDDLELMRDLAARRKK